MKEITGNLFQTKTYESQIGGKPDCICITTNGFVKRDGSAVMGRGCALEAMKLFPSLPSILGSSISENGNHVSVLLQRKGKAILVSFPVKPSYGKNVLPQYKEKMNDRWSPGWACYSQ